MERKIKNYAQLYLIFFIYSLISVLAKFAANQVLFSKTVQFLVGEIFLLGVYALLWQQILKKFSLVVAMSNKGITVILSLIWAAMIFDEQVTVWNIIGSVIIMFGIWMVSSDG